MRLDLNATCATWAKPCWREADGMAGSSANGTRRGAGTAKETPLAVIRACETRELSCEQQSSPPAIAPQSWPIAAQHAFCASVISSPVAQFADRTTANATASVHAIGRVQRVIHVRIAFPLWRAA